MAEALADHKPFLVAFATPKFCKTAQCGPTLDRLKPFVAKYPDVAFINVEPYKLKFEDGSSRPTWTRTSADRPVEATDEWGLVAEPWVFVVDRDGIVRGSFGLTISEAELDADPAGHLRRRLRLVGASSSLIATVSAASVRNQTRTGWAVAWCSTRWPGGNSRRSRGRRS